MEQPPIIQMEPPTGGKAGLGRIGLYFSLAALGALGLLYLANPNFMNGCPSAKPG
jgi:hypothetical protein